jgi:RHS repeat-associated protein
LCGRKASCAIPDCRECWRWSQLPYNLRFPGQNYQAETGLSQNMQRDFDPQVGRYTESDPIGLAGGVNTYAYTGDDPIMNFDDLGLAQCSYSISAHTLTCTPNAGGDPVTLGPNGVWSGVGHCANKASCANDIDYGPVVPGNYNMNRDNRPGHEGFWRLEPNPTIPGWKCDLHWDGVRCGFELHPGSISLGCITADKKNVNAMKQYAGVNKLLVSEDGANSLVVKP